MCLFMQFSATLQVVVPCRQMVVFHIQTMCRCLHDLSICSWLKTDDVHLFSRFLYMFLQTWLQLQKGWPL